MMIKTFGLILFFSSSQSQSLFRPNLPAGEYRVVYDKIYPCSSTKNYSLQMNWHLSKKTYNVTELKGNMTYLIPFDDTLTGEYNLLVDKVYPCEKTKKHPLQFNWYLSKKTSNITELKGNMTFLIPFDDTLTLDFNVASWGSTGGWVPNAYIMNSKKACSKAKYISGISWLTIMESFNIPTDKCPLPVGTYITSGIDKKNLENFNIPKVYFYGKYKVVFRYKTLNNEVVSCTVAEFNLIRPWETPI